MKRFAPVYLLLFCLLAVYCSDTAEKQTPPKESTGAELAQIYCVSCHQFPQPELLDKATWKNYVLIRMAAFMGIYEDNTRYYDQMPAQWLEPGPGGQRIKAANVYPTKALLSRTDWEKIKNYYLTEAPDQLPGASASSAIKTGIPFFESRLFSIDKTISPLIQSMGVDRDRKRIYASVFQGGIFEFDFSGKQKGHAAGNTYISQIQSKEQSFISLDMGTRLASDNPQGRLRIASSWNDFMQSKKINTLDSLMRPVHFSKGDLTGDNRPDYVISEYGNLLGNLAWYEALPDGKNFTKHILFPDDGAICSSLLDFNKDGLTDILALQANADEGIDLYLNNGDKTFERSRQLRFPPTYGSTHFEMVDFNQDGQEDLLVSNGDNGDYPPILKPYHGIRLYLQKNQQFSESFFLPLNGVYQASARDFDLDGDLDIAAVSFHPDFRNSPKESFVLFINDGHQNFTAHTIPQFAHSRWMRFLTVDIDTDGDLDILLSAFNIKTPEIPREVADKWVEQDEAILILENGVR